MQGLCAALLPVQRLRQALHGDGFREGGAGGDDSPGRGAVVVASSQRGTSLHSGYPSSLPSLL